MIRTGPACKQSFDEEGGPMLRDRLMSGLLTVLLTSTLCAFAKDAFTPLIGSPLTPNTIAFSGTDGKQHIVYELIFTNTRPTPATITGVEVVGPAPASETLASYSGAELLKRLRNLANQPVDSAEIEFNGSRLLLVELVFDTRAQVPSRLEHRVRVMAAGAPGPADPAVPLSYTIAPISVSSDPFELGAPVAGKGWVAVNGCCEPGGVHRSSGLPVNGQIYFAQRFAIDWMLLDAEGHLVKGDPADVHSYPCYGVDVLAVADGTVVDTLGNLDDQVPGELPDPKTINIDNVDGNHIVLDLGRGRYAFYAHLQKDSLHVAVGDHVHRGQVLAKLGNTGNTSGPHLHFHLMDGASVLGSQGLPYTIDHFYLAGKLSKQQFDAAKGVEGNWSQGLYTQPMLRKSEFPLDRMVVNF
jgi:hypothetical protein